MNISAYFIPVFILIVFIFSFIKRINAYDAFLKGVKSGLNTSLFIFPTMLAMYIAINMLDKSGLLDVLFSFEDIPNEILAQTMFRPFSSQASLGMMLEVYKKYGVDSTEGMISSIIQGSTDSSIYIMSLYLNAYGIKKTSKCYIFGFLINLLGFLFSIFIYYLIYKF